MLPSPNPDDDPQPPLLDTEQLAMILQFLMFLVVAGLTVFLVLMYPAEAKTFIGFALLFGGFLVWTKMFL